MIIQNSIASFSRQCGKKITRRDLKFPTFPSVDRDLNWDCGVSTSDGKFSESHNISKQVCNKTYLHCSVSYSSLASKHTETSIWHARPFAIIFQRPSYECRNLHTVMRLSLKAMAVRYTKQIKTHSIKKIQHFYS